MEAKIIERERWEVTLVLAVVLAILIIGVACGDPSTETVADPMAETVTYRGASMARATPIPTPTAQGSARPQRMFRPRVATPSDEGIESMLSGDTLARYRALPPAFQAALDTYAWFGVPPDLIPLAVRDKMDQWGDAAIPLAEIIGEERAERFRDTSSPFVVCVLEAHTGAARRSPPFGLRLSARSGAVRRATARSHASIGQRPHGSNGFTYPACPLAGRLRPFHGPGVRFTYLARSPAGRRRPYEDRPRAS